jgi:paraquat-inducible protein A
MLPILTVIQFGSGAPDTIISGVAHLFAEGQWPIAVLVFVASVLVPLVKITVLMFLLISVHGRWRWRVRERTQLFHVIDALGRWSMIDIFMISILVALVQLGTIATIEPGIGAAYFGIVVVCTMLAAITFDPRLLWDSAGPPPLLNTAVN